MVRVLFFSQGGSLPPVENILKIVLECKALLSELRVNPPAGFASRKPENDGEVGVKASSWEPDEYCELDFYCPYVVKINILGIFLSVETLVSWLA